MFSNKREYNSRTVYLAKSIHITYSDISFSLEYAYHLDLNDDLFNTIIILLDEIGRLHHIDNISSHINLNVYIKIIVKIIAEFYLVNALEIIFKQDDVLNFES